MTAKELNECCHIFSKITALMGIRKIDGKEYKSMMAAAWECEKCGMITDGEMVENGRLSKDKMVALVAAGIVPPGYFPRD